VTELSLATSEARDVLAAVVARVARDAGLDVLLIKGPSLAVHGLRGERAWGDVDVLVRPEHVSQLRRELAASGWEAFNETPDYPLINLPHAITLIHPRWHTEVDVHTFLPGSYVEAATTFEHLWDGRTSIELAHQPVPCTGRIGSALVAALNLARTAASPRARDETRQWCAAVGTWPDADRIALATLATKCRAADVLAPLFDEAGVPPTGRGALTQLEWNDWRDRVRQEERDGHLWVTAVRRAPARRKLGLAIRALTYDPAATEGGLPQPTGWARVRHAARRLRLAASLFFRRKS
jgi:hypothetical protein